jgi:hypothetical protein
MNIIVKVFLAFLLCTKVLNAELDKNRLDLPDKGFSIIPPEGWEIDNSYPGLSLLMQIPKEPEVYQRTIQVMRFSGTKDISESTETEFAKILQERFSSSFGAQANYTIRSHAMIDLYEYVQGVVYYAAFLLNGKDMMHAHLLVSSNTHHYLLTYTDVKENIEGEGAELYRDIAWGSIISVRLDNPALSLFVKFKWLFILLIILGVSGVLYKSKGVVLKIFSFFRKKEDFESDLDSISLENSKKDKDDTFSDE